MEAETLEKKAWWCMYAHGVLGAWGRLCHRPLIIGHGGLRQTTIEENCFTKKLCLISRKWSQFSQQ